MKYSCQDCKKSFSLEEAPKVCPFCGSDKIGSKSKFATEQMITEYTELQEKMDTMQSQLDVLAAEYIPTYLKSAKLKTMLGVYKSRKVITDKEIPETKKRIIQCLVPKYPDIVKAYKEQNEDNNTETE